MAHIGIHIKWLKDHVCEKSCAENWIFCSVFLLLGKNVKVFFANTEKLRKNVYHPMLKPLSISACFSYLFMGPDGRDWQVWKAKLWNIGKEYSRFSFMIPCSFSCLCCHPAMQCKSWQSNKKTRNSWRLIEAWRESPTIVRGLQSLWQNPSEKPAQKYQKHLKRDVCNE